MSMFYCEVDPAAGNFDELAGPGMPLPLSVLENARYEESVRAVAAGQIIVIGTDGIWETRNAQGEYFGKNRLMNVVGRQADRPPQDIVAAVLERLNTFRGRLAVEDDATLVVVKLQR